MDQHGNRLAQRRLPEAWKGSVPCTNSWLETPTVRAVVIGIETDRGLSVDALMGAGYQVYAINRWRYRATATVITLPGPSPTLGTPRFWPTSYSS